MEEKNGYIILNKSAGMTSQTAVNRVKRLFGAKKAGHTGTLDPMATGVLPILFGRATKMCDFLTESRKHYEAELLLGVTTDTEDISGTILSECNKIPEESEVRAAVRSFVGEILQVPPMYSALKRDGQKLCNLARRGLTVEREPRPITVEHIECEKLERDRYRLDVICSKGTYIRTLCADIGEALGVGGTCAALHRVETAGFHIDTAYTLDQLEAMDDAHRMDKLRPVEELLQKYPRVTLPPFFAHLADCGCEIYQKKIGTHYALGELLTLCDDAGIFALAEVREYEDGLALKPIRKIR